MKRSFEGASCSSVRAVVVLLGCSGKAPPAHGPNEVGCFNSRPLPQAHKLPQPNHPNTSRL